MWTSPDHRRDHIHNAGLFFCPPGGSDRTGYGRRMRLPVHLLRSLQEAYLETYRRELGDDDAQALGLELLEYFGQLAMNRLSQSLDGARYKRDDSA